MKLPQVLVRPAVMGFLRLHNFSYRALGLLSARLEPDGLHPKHRIMNYHGFFMKNVRATDTVLDVGCGNGALAVDVAPHCRRLIGVDFNAASIESARRRIAKAGVKNAEFVHGDATKILLDEKIDCVILSNVLEHIEKRVEILIELGKRADRFLIRVPLIDREWLAPYKKELGIEYRLDPTHFTEYTLEQFRSELSAAGLRIENHQIQFGEIWAVCVKL